MANGNNGGFLKLSLWIASGLLGLTVIILGWAYGANLARLESIELRQTETVRSLNDISRQLAVLETKEGLTRLDILEIKKDIRELSQRLQVVE